MAAGTPQWIKDEDGEEVGRLWTRRTYQVPVDTVAEGLAPARTAVAGLPYPEGQRLVKLGARRIDKKPRLIEVVAEYELKLNQGEDSNAENPLDRPSQYSTTSQTWEEGYFEDSNGDSVLNTAGRPFAQFPKRKNGRYFIRIIKNVATDQSGILTFVRNADSVTIRGTTHDPGTLLMYPVTCQEKWERSGNTTYHYFVRETIMEVDPDEFFDNIEDRGFEDLDGPITDPTSHTQVKAPWPLDGTGHRMANATDSPNVRSFEPYEKVTWGLDFT